MQTSYYASTAGMVAQLNRLENISNNLANINTTGFKKDGEIIGDYLRLFKENRDILPIPNQTKKGAKYINRNFARVPQVVEKYTDFKNGSLIRTDNEFDIALKQRNLFFVIQKPNGEYSLTKNGSFSISPDGSLVTKSGNLVMGSRGDNLLLPINISTANSKLTIDKDGRVYIDNNTYAGINITVSRVRNLKDLKKEGDNLYNIKDFDDNVFTVNNSHGVVQGYLEGSNVNGVSEMSNLIDTSRLIDIYQKVMDTQMNEMNKDIINKIAVKG